MRASPLLFLGVVSATVVLDQMTKLWVQRALEPYAALPIIPNLLAITHVLNPGAAFGMLAQAPAGAAFLVFVTVAVVVIVAILIFWRRIAAHTISLQVAFGLVLGGAVGNLIDRIRLRAVVDFIDFHWFQYHWPAFNAADASICVGLGLVVLDVFRASRGRVRR